MATWGDAQLLEKGDTFYVLSETPSNSQTLTGPLQITPSLFSTLTSAACSQYAMNLGRLQQEVKNVQKDLNSFQQKVIETLQKLEGKLSYLTDVVSSLENRSHDVEQRLVREEDRGIARSKVLTFLLPREKELRERGADLCDRFLSRTLSPPATDREAARTSVSDSTHPLSPHE
uniref:Uncharacterized protein n=1 Tax=Sphaerodactylus townsendi TaxID=933632 RepID=A0ACB8EBX4_9SAUR